MTSSGLLKIPKWKKSLMRLLYDLTQKNFKKRGVYSGQNWLNRRKLSMYVRSETRVHPTTRMPGNGAPTITLMWEKRQANAGKIPRAKEIGIIARSAFILRSIT